MSKAPHMSGDNAMLEHLPELVCNCLAARKAARYLTAVYDRTLAPTGIRITQFTILYKLARVGPMTIKRLASDMAMDRTTLAVNLKPLERDGLWSSAPIRQGRAGRDRIPTSPDRHRRTQRLYVRASSA
jgi:hypothetical protein